MARSLIILHRSSPLAPRDRALAGSAGAAGFRWSPSSPQTLNLSTPAILDYTQQMASADLLKQIQAGRSLKKAVINDRSTPQVEPKKAGGGAGASGRVGGAGIGSAAAPTIAGRSNGAPSAPAASGGGPPQLGGLFAGGMPKLKPAATSGASKYYSLYPVSCILYLLHAMLILMVSKNDWPWETAAYSTFCGCIRPCAN